MVNVPAMAAAVAVVAAVVVAAVAAAVSTPRHALCRPAQLQFCAARDGRHRGRDAAN